MTLPDLLPLLGIAAATVYATALALLAVHAAHSLALAVCFARQRRRVARIEAIELERPLPRDGELPHVLVQLPVYDERDVVARAVASAGRLDWPRDRLTIQLLDDGSDDSVALGARAIATLRRAGVDAHHVRRGSRIGFKAGALEHGLARCPAAEFVAIFDADFVPAPDFLRRAISPLLADPGLALVQGRWEHLNPTENALTRAQALGIDAHFTVEQAARAWGGLAMNFNGTCGLWRRTAIDSAGGWQHDTLTEDLDLSYRAQLAGWRCTYRLGLAVPGELPADVHAWRAQQFRWAKGSQQTTAKLAARIWRSEWSLAKRVAALLHISHYVVHPLIVVSLVAAPLAAALAPAPPTWLAIAAIALVALGMLAPPLIHALAHRSLGRPWREFPRRVGALTALGSGIALSNSRAVWEAWRGHRSPFVRTPKRGDGPGSYRAARGNGIGELVAGAWALTGIVASVDLGRAWLAPLLATYAVGFLVVGIACRRDLRRPAGGDAASPGATGDAPLADTGRPGAAPPRNRTAAQARSASTSAAVAGLALCGGVALAAWLALRATPSRWVETPRWHTALGLVAGAAMLAAIPLAPRAGRHATALVLGFALAFRIAAGGIEPSDDLNRYVAEGALVTAGGNPYATSPAASAPQLAGRVAPEILAGVNHPDWTAIYPPLGTLAQAAVASLAPTVAAQRLAAVLAELAALGLLLALLRRRGLGVAAILPWAWNPVAIAWVAGEGHNDSFALLGLVAALSAWDARREVAGTVAATLGALCKPFAGAALVAQLAARPDRRIALAIGIAALAALPFLGAGAGLTASLGRFGHELHHAGVITPWIRGAAERLGAAPDALGAIGAAVSLAVFAIGLAAIVRRGRADADPLRAPGRATLLLLVCLPTLHPWYLLVLLPFVALHRSPWLVAWTAITPLHWLHGVAMDGGARWAQVGAVTAVSHAPLYAAALVGVGRALRARPAAIRAGGAPVAPSVAEPSR